MVMLDHGIEYGKREFGHGTNHCHRARSLDTAEQVIFHPPEETVEDSIVQRRVTVGKFMVQPADVRLNSLAPRGSSCRQVDLLGGEHLK